MLVAQSSERDVAKRKELVWQIEHFLNEEVVRPIISHGRSAQCWQPYVKGRIRAENSIYSNWRHHTTWLDR